MSMKKPPTGNQSNGTLSKPPGNRTVLSPRARGKRASVKMADSIKDSEKARDDKKELGKDDVDRESVPLSEKEAHMDKKDIFRIDSTLSNGDVVTSIPNMVPNETKNGDVESNIPGESVADSIKSETIESSSSNDNTVIENNTSSSLTDKGDKEHGDTTDNNVKCDTKENETIITNSTKGSTVSVNSRESKSETCKSSTISLKDDATKSSTLSVNSTDTTPTLSKGSSVQSKASKSNSVKGSTVSLTSKETKAESRPSSMKKTTTKSTIPSANSSENETNKTSTPNGLKKGNTGPKGDKLNGGLETKVKVTDSKSNGTKHNTLSDSTPNNVIGTDIVSLTVPGQPADGADTPNSNVEARKDSIAADSLRRESTKFSFGSRKSVDIRLQYTAVQMPTTEDKTKPSVYATDDSWIRIAIPYMPVGMAVFCLCLNICVPGLGTILSGFSIFCCGVSRVPSKYDQDAIVILCVNIWVGVAQLFTVSFMLVGWFWSLAWGIKMVILAVERRQELKDMRAKELQTLALKAFGSSIPAAHMTTIS